MGTVEVLKFFDCCELGKAIEKSPEGKWNPWHRAVGTFVGITLQNGGSQRVVSMAGKSVEH
jgi:hypothetical protein